jgi:ankyrin repeat protein
VRRTLDELPESLDETYERILKEIKKPNRDHARRLLSCLVAAVRPLRVEELAEVLAVDYDDEEGIPRLNPNWRWEDQEQALLTSCSSLIAIVKSGALRVVQFSHFSVKEFLTSSRLSTSSGDVLHYHIYLEPAHAILAQACMSALLRSDDRAEENDVESSSPLSRYAAEHWVAHAKYGDVSACLQKAMEYLFDLDKPYFAAWQQLYDIDTMCPMGSTLFRFILEEKSDAHPLYYAALCGFQDLVKHLILKYPQHADARGGYYVTPLVAALGGEHFQTARILCDNGADPNVKGNCQTTALHSAAYYGDLRMVQVLLELNADVNAREDTGYTPLHYLSVDFYSGPKHSQLHNVSRVLLEHGADVNARNNDLSTALHMAAREGWIEVVRVLLEHGADVNARKGDHSTALHSAARGGSFEVVRVLLEHGASVGAEDKYGRTPFQLASLGGHSDIVKLLWDMVPRESIVL